MWIYIVFEIQGVVYLFKWGFCHASCVGFTHLHLYRRVSEYQSSTIGNFFTWEHNMEFENLDDKFTIPRSCKIECSLNEMLAIRDLKTNNNRLTNWEKQFCNYDNWFQMVTFSCHFSYLSSWAHNCRSIYKTWTEFCFWLDNEILKISWRYILLTPSTFGWKLTRIKMDKVPFVFKIVLLEIKF